MSEWFQRQFGDRGEFALIVSLGVDPHPSGQVARDLPWGSLEIWARGRCLTESILEGSVSQGVRWNLLPVLEWLLEVGIRLVNEDPYPRFSKGRAVSDGSSWYDATLSPPMLSPEAERRWFLRRSEWRHHHALRRAAEGVALPNVVFRRLGDHVEVSWDNESWAPPRSNLRFVEPRGRVLTQASQFGAVIQEALVEVLTALLKRTGHAEFQTLYARATALKATETDWRWLVHRPTAALIRSEMPALCKSLDEATARDRVGLYVPHTPETLMLRHVRLIRKQDVDAVLRVAALLPEQPIAADLRTLVRPRPASSERPWEEGNDYAELVRDQLGWGTQPIPDLGAWLEDHGISVPLHDLGLPASMAVFSKRTDDARAMVHVNPHTSQIRKETGLATGLGHILLDDGLVSVDGDWEHWPTSARARAFGVALMLPEDGIRQLLSDATSVGVDEVRHVMHLYRSGPWATTYRLRNLGLITPDEQMELAQAVSHSGDPPRAFT